MLPRRIPDPISFFLLSPGMADTVATRLTDLGSSMPGYQTLDNADSEGDKQEGKNSRGLVL